MAKKNIGKTNETVQHPGTTSRTRVVDPAEKYYEQSRKDREAYKKALKMNQEGPWSDDYLAERHHPVLHQEGNAQSRSGFDFRTFRNKN